MSWPLNTSKSLYITAGGKIKFEIDRLIPIGSNDGVDQHD